MRFPIFQLCWHSKDGSVGLVFASELSYYTQTFGFFVPIYPPKIHILGKENLNNQIRPNQYYFPCEIGGEYVELIAEIDYSGNFPIFNFVSAQQDRFSFNRTLHQGDKDSLDVKDMYGPLKYIGNESKHNFKKFSFLEIYPSDVELLNKFFNDKKGIFVGYTNNFGRYLADNIAAG